MKRQEEIDWLRGFAAFLVILGHSIIIYPINLHNVVWCKCLYDIIYSFHMPLFFAIAGYCYSIKQSYRAYITKKIKRIGLPFVFFAFVEIIPRFLFIELVNNKEDVGTLAVNNILYGGHYWFLYTMFMVFLIFPLIEKLFEKNAFITTLLVFLLGCNAQFFPIILCLRWTLYYMVFFLIGYLLRKMDVFKKMAFIKNNSFTKSGILMMAIIVIMFICGYFHGRYDITILNLFEGLVGVFSCFALTQMFGCMRAFEKYSSYSLPLYLLNGYLLVISRTIIVSCLKVTNPLIIIIFNMFVAFYISYLLVRFVLGRIRLAKLLLGIQ